MTVHCTQFDNTTDINVWPAGKHKTWHTAVWKHVSHQAQAKNMIYSSQLLNAPPTHLGEMLENLQKTPFANTAYQRGLFQRSPFSPTANHDSSTILSQKNPVNICKYTLFLLYRDFAADSTVFWSSSPRFNISSPQTSHPAAFATTRDGPGPTRRRTWPRATMPTLLTSY